MKRKHGNLCLTFGVLFMGYDAPVASAQVLYGSIIGTVTDPANAMVPNAAVTVTNLSTGLFREVSSSEAGYYSVANLPEGKYNVKISASGFKLITQKNVNVLINNATRIDVMLWAP